MPTTPPLPPEPPTARVPGPPPPPPNAPGSGEPPRGEGRRAVVVLSIVSVVLAVALVAMSLAWWRERDAGAAEQLVPDTSTDDGSRRSSTTEEPATEGADPSSPSGDGGRPIPAPAPDQVPDGAPNPDGGTDEGGTLDDLTGALEDLLGGGLGDLGDLGGLGDLGDLDGLSPECLGAEVGDLFDSLLGGEELTGTLDDQIREIADRVEDQRQLGFDEPIDPVLLPADQFDRRIAETVADEYPASEADLDSRLLVLLGVLPAGTDLLALQADLLAGQVAGFYDPETGEIVVRDDGDGELDTTEQITLAHELDHALTDQALGLPDISGDGQTDGDLAALALVEGDATLLMQQYALAHVGLMDQLGQLTDPSIAAAQAELDDVAPYLREEMMFPYVTGLSYACRLHADGGWPAVDGAYDDLPSTTAEVMFEDRAGVEPVDPTDPGEPPSPWTVERRDTVGAAQLSWLFGAPGSDESAALDGADELAASWAGGELVLATDDDDSALGLALVDRTSDGTLCAAMDEWYGRSFDGDVRTIDGTDVVHEGSDQVAVLRCDGTDVRLGIAPDIATATALAD